MFTASNASLRLLISRAYGVLEAQIEGGTTWIDTDTWDIAAKADTALEMTLEELRPCLQALLAARFQLRIHRQTMQGAVFSLVVAKGGPKLLKQHLGAGASGIGASSGAGQVSITGTKTTMSRLAEYLGGQAGHPVVDNTGLQGGYDFRIEWSTDDRDQSGPSVFGALAAPRNQTGINTRGDRNDRGRPSGKGLPELTMGLGSACSALRPAAGRDGNWSDLYVKTPEERADCLSS